MAGTNTDYTESSRTKSLRKKAEELEQSAPAAYTSANADRLGSLYNALTQRQGFTYNPSSDSLYQAYRRQYTALGRQAMEDTMGQNAALTGGYTSSYAQSAGQQAYDSWLGKLTDQLPELAETAREAYDSEGDALLQQYNLALQQENTDYSRWQDTLSNYYKQLNLARDAYDSERSFDYGAHRDAVEDAQWQADYNLSAARAAGSTSTSGTGKTASADYDGMTAAQLEAKVKQLLAKLPAAQAARVIQSGAAGLTTAQAQQALKLLSAYL